jgi:cytoskeletal protein CcmA (bactofilin family)
MAITTQFFNKREPELASVRPGSAAPGAHANVAANHLATQHLANTATPAPTQLPPVKEGGSKLTVGPNIKLKGVEITDCDTLVVEGLVEATMDSRVMQISERGAFKGSAEIDIAEIHGQFEGNLTVRQKLMIFGTGRVHGKVRYGKVVIEEGGQLTGDIQFGATAVPKVASVERAGLTLAV